MAAEGMQSHDQSCGNCPTASHPATKKGRINAPILPKPTRCAKSDRLLERTQERFDLKPKRLAADMAYGTGKFLGWLVKIKKIIPHIPVLDKSDRQDGVFSRSDFRLD